MKKFTFMMAALMVVMSSFAQDRIISSNGKYSKSINSVQQSQGLQRNGQIQAAAIIYTQDFNGGVPPTWTVTDSAGNGEVWAHTTTGPGNTLISPLASTTASNGWMIADDDTWGNNSTQASTSITSDAIDCSMYPNVLLTLEQHFLQYLTGQGVIYVSNDNTNWVAVHSAHAGLAQDQETSNPYKPVINISSVAGGQSTVYLRFTYRGNWDYLWQIDDIQLFEPAAVDGSVGPDDVIASCGLGATEQVTAVFYNNGGNPFSGFDVSFSVNGGTPVVENIAATLNPGDSIIYTFTGTADLSAPGAHTIDYTITVTGDGDPANDQSTTTILNNAESISNGFEVTDYLNGWVVEDANADGEAWGLADNASFTVPAHTGDYCLRVSFLGTTVDDWIISSCVELQSGINYSLDFWHHLFNSTGNEAGNFEAYAGTTNNAAGMTQLITTAAGSLLGWTNSTSTFTVPASGSYYIGIRALSGAGDAGIMRLDDVVLDIASGISESAAELKWFDVYPNPASSNLNVRMNRPYDVASVEIINALGAVASRTMVSSEITNVDVSNLESGLYTAKLIVDGKEVNKRFTIAR